MKPKIVCLCGSARFLDAYARAQFDETVAGKIVLTIGCNTKYNATTEGVVKSGELAIRLDTLHFWKIKMADEVLFLNVGGYMGESTRRELAYAKRLKKVIRFLEAGQ
jgi:hypothetical protein